MKHACKLAILALGLIGCQAQNGEIGGTIQLTSTDSLNETAESLRKTTEKLSDFWGQNLPSGTVTYGGTADNSDFNLDYTSGGTDVEGGFIEIDVDFSNLVVTKLNGFRSADVAKASPVVQIHEDHTVNVNPKLGSIDGIVTTSTGNKLLDVNANFYIQFNGLIGEFDELGGNVISGDFNADKVVPAE